MWENSTILLLTTIPFTASPYVVVYLYCDRINPMIGGIVVP